jgi:hypothetical protein
MAHKRYVTGGPPRLRQVMFNDALTMQVHRHEFIVPDETPAPQGKRTLTVGRRSYTWSTARDVRPVERTGTVTSRLSDEDNGTTLEAVALTDGTMGYAAGRSVARTADMGDAPIPTIRKIAKHKPVKRTPRKAAPQGKSKAAVPAQRRTGDDVIRSVIAKAGGPRDVKITPAVRRAALDLIQAKRQRKDYARG